MIRKVLAYAMEEVYHHREKYLIFTFLFALGLAGGMAAPHLLAEADMLESKRFLADYVLIMPAVDISFAVEFASALGSKILPVAAILLCGLHICGLPMMVLILLYQAFSAGFTIGFAFDYESGFGVLVFLFVMLPQLAVMLPVVIISAVQSTALALSLRKRHYTGRLLLSYARFALLALVLCAVAALFQAFCSPLLLKIVL
jgi:uncharacterized membrane protein SpoIIM required for sporulation